MFASHSGYADHYDEKKYRSIEKHTNSKKKNMKIVVDFNPELGPGYGVERVSVGPHTLNEGNKRVSRLDEAMADDTKFHSTQHDVQKNA